MNRKLHVFFWLLSVAVTVFVKAQRPPLGLIVPLVRAVSTVGTSFANKEALRRYPWLFKTQKKLPPKKEFSVTTATESACMPLASAKQKVNYASEIWRTVFLSEHKRVFGEKTDWKYDAARQLLVSKDCNTAIAFVFVGEEYANPELKSDEVTFRIFVGDEEDILNMRHTLVVSDSCSDDDFFFYKTARGGYGAFRGRGAQLVHGVYFSSGAFSRIYTEIKKNLMKI